MLIKNGQISKENKLTSKINYLLERKMAQGDTERSKHDVNIVKRVNQLQINKMSIFIAFWQCGWLAQCIYVQRRHPKQNLIRFRKLLELKAAQRSASCRLKHLIDVSSMSYQNVQDKSPFKLLWKRGIHLSVSLTLIINLIEWLLHCYRRATNIFGIHYSVASLPSHTFSCLRNISQTFPSLCICLEWHWHITFFIVIILVISV